MLFGRVQIGERLVDLGAPFVTMHRSKMSESVALPRVVELALFVSSAALALRNEPFTFDSADHPRSIPLALDARVDTPPESGLLAVEPAE
jgi:hypothetical protein